MGFYYAGRADGYEFVPEFHPAVRSPTVSSSTSCHVSVLHPIRIRIFRSFQTRPLDTKWKILALTSNYLSQFFFWATQPLANILDSEFLLCQLGAAVHNILHVLSALCVKCLLYASRAQSTWHVIP